MERVDFNSGWTFRKIGGAARRVTLPHDAMQTEERAPGNPSGPGCAYYGGGVYLYEKRFVPPAAWAGKRVIFEFEGAYPQAEVTLNGVPVGGCAYGYEQFTVPGDGLRPGEENVLSVRVDNADVPNSRWYSGAGLHRPVFAYVGERESIAPYGLRVRTLSVSPAAVEVTVSHTGAGEPEIALYDGDILVASGRGNRVRLEIPDARLWSAERPYLYTCRAVLPSGDAAQTRFGVRTLAWDSHGLRVNGVTVKLRGGCVHHDNGILGARSYPESERRRVRLLRDAGFNAIRSAHNPASRSLLEACDELGLYVMDEGWDMWFTHKNPGDYAGRFEGHWRRDLEAMVEKDFNHPCVIMYSIGNEISEPAGRRGLTLAGELVETLHRLDSSRPVTSGANLVILTEAYYQRQGGGIGADRASDSAEFNRLLAEQFHGMCTFSARPEVDKAVGPYFELLDIAGYNYASARYAFEGQRHPERIVVGSETFPFQLTENWRAVEENDWLIGDFMWTAWDYLGETGIGAWTYEPDGMVFAKPCPWLLADSGAFDILGDDNAEAGLAMVTWDARKTPYIGVAPPDCPGKPQYRGAWRGSDALPSWSWRGCEGNETRVEVYTKAPRAALYVNDRLVDARETRGYRADFTLPYQPGTLRAVALDGEGNALNDAILRSATGALSLRLTAEAAPAAGRPLYLRVEIVGENGVVESNADRPLEIEVTGGELLAFGSARPRTESRFETGRYESYRGRAQAVILPERNVAVRVSGQGLPDAAWTASLPLA